MDELFFLLLGADYLAYRQKRKSMSATEYFEYRRRAERRFWIVAACIVAITTGLVHWSTP